MRKDKRQRALQAYKGFAGSQTIAHVERNLLNGFPTAKTSLTGVQYGQVMNVANMSYRDGKNTALPKGISMAEDCIYIDNSNQLIPVDVLQKIKVIKSTEKTKIDCTGSSKHYINYNNVYYSDGRKLLDRLEAYHADLNKTPTYYIKIDNITKYMLDEVEKC